MSGADWIDTAGSCLGDAIQRAPSVFAGIGFSDLDASDKNGTFVRDTYERLLEVVEKRRQYSREATPVFVTMVLCLLAYVIKRDRKSEEDSGDEDLKKTNDLVTWLLEVSEMPYFYQVVGEHWNRIGLSELASNRARMIRMVIESIRKEDVSRLEQQYGLITESVSSLLKQYAFKEAWVVLGRTQGWYGRVSELLLGSPLFAGILVGWLVFLPEEKLYGLTFGLWEYGKWPFLLAHFLWFFVAWILIFGFVRESAERQGADRPGRTALFFVMGGWAISWAVGFVIMLLVGAPFIREMLGGDVNPSMGAGDSALCLAGKVSLGWSLMSLIVGIFGQLIWSGRGPLGIFGRRRT